MYAIFFWEDHGSLTEMSFMMGGRTHTPWIRMVDTHDASNRGEESERGGQHKHASHEWEGTPERSKERIGDAVCCCEET